MKRSFVIPASVAIAVHALLFFGFTSAKPRPVAKPTPEKISDAFLLALRPDDPPPLTPIDEARSEKQSIDPPPTRSEPIGKVAVDNPIEVIAPSNDPMSVDSIIMISSSIPKGKIDGKGVESGLREILGMGELDNAPRTKSQPSPVYPPACKAAGLSGEVIVEFYVDEAGFVHEPRVLKSSHDDFSATALRAVSRWRFFPGKKNGTAVAFRMSVPLVFSLSAE